MTASTMKKVVVSITAVLYVIHLAFNALAAQGGNGNKLFPRQTGEVSDVFYLEMTPVGATFSIWGFIFFFQLLWIIYSLVNLCRNVPSADILSTKFYVFFIINIVFITMWLLLWARLETVWCLVVISLGQIFVEIAIETACVDLKKFLETNDFQTTNKIDIWCNRILVQNGLLFYATWTTVATLINTAIVLSYDLDWVSTLTASYIALSVLTVLALAWFFLESFVVRSYTEYTFSAYITLIYAVSGIYANKRNDGIQTFAIVLLVLSIVLLVTRVFILICRKPRNIAIKA